MTVRARDCGHVIGRALRIGRWGCSGASLTPPFVRAIAASSALTGIVGYSKITHRMSLQLQAEFSQSVIGQALLK
jgi:hypothetical protein